MPGEERKFKRRRIVAFVPTCRRERELAASHTASAEGICTIGVAVDWIPGVAVGEGRGVTVRAEVFVPVGDGIGTGVPVSGREVGDAGAIVGAAASGCPEFGEGVAEGLGTDVAVCASD